MQLNIITDIWDTATNSILQIRDLIVAFFDVIDSTFSFIPRPWGDIIQMFIPIFAILLVVKVVKFFI